MRKLLLAALGALVLSTAAWAAGTFQGYPVAGTGTSSSLTLPLTGIEQIPADTGLTAGVNPATELITTSQLAMYGVGSTLAYTTAAGSVTAMTATQNVRAGDIQTQAMTLTNGSNATLTVTNSFAKAGGMVFAVVANGTNTTDGAVVTAVTPAAGSFVITIANRSGSAALNGNLRVKYFVVF